MLSAKKWIGSASLAFGLLQLLLTAVSGLFSSCFGQSGFYKAGSGRVHTINYNDVRLGQSVNALLTYIEGSFGALLMVASGLAAILLATIGQFRASFGMFIVAVAAFILRSMTGTFFNDTNISDGYYYAAPIRPLPAATALHANTAAFAAFSLPYDARHSPLEALLHDENTVPTALSALRLASPRLEDKSVPDAEIEPFLQGRERTENLTFVPSYGAWANTYLPDAPRLHELRAELESYNLPPAVWNQRADIPPHRLVRPFNVPLDNTGFGSIKLALNSDRAEINGETRALIQLSIKGAEDPPLRRAPINAGIIIGNPAEFNSQLKSLLQSLVLAVQQHKQPGDRIFLATPREGGLAIIKSGDLRYGTLQLALQDLVENADKTKSSLLSEAIKEVTDGFEQSSGAVAAPRQDQLLIVCPRAVGSDFEQLQAAIKGLSERGTRVSTLGLPGSMPEELKQLARAGAGKHHDAHSADEIQRFIGNDILGGRPGVAYNVRLSIRLGENVRLVGMVGSRPLEGRESAAGVQTPAREDKSIDVFIPVFYANDGHVLLFDTVISKPGIIADAEAHFFDPLHGKEQSSYAQISISKGDAPRGPAQFNVIKNTLAYHFSKALSQAAEAVGAGNIRQAYSYANYFKAMLDEVVDEEPFFARDADIIGDYQAVEAFLGLLGRALENRSIDYKQLQNSLYFAALAKILPQRARTEH